MLNWPLSTSRKIKGLVGWSATELLLTAKFLGLAVEDIMSTWHEKTPESVDGFEGWVPAAFKPGVGAAYRIRTDDLSLTRPARDLNTLLSLVFFTVLASVYSLYGNAGVTGKSRQVHFHPLLRSFHPAQLRVQGLFCAASPYGMGVKTNTDLLRTWQISMLAQSLSLETINERLRVVRQFQRASGAPARVASPEEITVWLSGLPSRATKHAYFLILRAWFRFLVLSDIRSDDPTIKVPRPKRPKYSPRPLFEEHLQAALGLNMRSAARTRILLAATAGLRVHEIAKINGTDFDGVTGVLTVEGKGKKTDLVPLHPILLEEAKGYPKRGYWFPSDHPRGFVGTGAVRTSITRVFDRVGVAMTPHQLRHFFATALLASEVDSRIVQKLMRHENLSTTALYMGVTITQQQQALDKLDLSKIFNHILPNQ